MDNKWIGTSSIAIPDHMPICPRQQLSLPASPLTGPLRPFVLPPRLPSRTRSRPCWIRGWPSRSERADLWATRQCGGEGAWWSLAGTFAPTLGRDSTVCAKLYLITRQVSLATRAVYITTTYL